MRCTLPLLLGAIVALAAASQAAGSNVHSVGGVFAKQLPNGYDYLFRWETNRWVRVDRVPLGSMRLRTPVASAIRSSDPSALEKTICLRIASGPARGRRCWREYRMANEDDPTRDYKVWWTTGSSRARRGARLVGLRDSVRGDARTEIVNWAPTSTKRASGCERVELALAPEPVAGSGFTTCRGRWGLRDLDARSLRFGWTGRRRAWAWIGTGGGAAFAYPQGGSLAVRLRFRQLYCLSGEADCKPKRPRNTSVEGA
jgi:hypothetical protein